jgi:hypothetical protein
MDDSLQASSAAAIAAPPGGPSVIRRAIPYAVSLAIFGLIFYRIPMRQVAGALRQVPALEFIALFFPYSLFYFAIDSACLTWVVRRFNAAVRIYDVLPIRASMYLLAMINTNLGQGGVAWYLHRKTGIAFGEALGSVAFIALIEVYQLFLFSTLGVLFYSPTSPRQGSIVAIVRIAYLIAWALLALIMLTFALARRSASIRSWIEGSRVGSVAGTFLKAKPLDYALVLAIKAPAFLGSVVVQWLALGLFSISVPLPKLFLFLPLVFLAAALPIGVAHLGTSQAAWLLFFSDSARPDRILAYSLAAHFVFMICNGTIGLLFLRRASRELTAMRSAAAPTPA